MTPVMLPIRLLGRDYFVPGHAQVFAGKKTVDGNVPMHDRDFMEIILVTQGTGYHRTIYGDTKIEPGDTFILRPGAWQAFHECVGLELFECRFGLEMLQRELAWTREDPGMALMFWAAPVSLDRRGVLQVRLPDYTMETCRLLLEDISSLIKKDPTGSRAEEVARLLMFVGEIGHVVTQSLQVIRKGKPEPHLAVSDGIRLMEEDIRRDWTLPELAKRLNVDKSYLVRLFRAHTGSPPMQFLARIRAERAALLLLRTAREISVIGEQVGWSDPNYFARRFKAHFGLSASKYREHFARETQAAMAKPITLNRPLLNSMAASQWTAGM